MLWVDRYGNAQLNVDPDEIEGWGDARAAALWDGGSRDGRRWAAGATATSAPATSGSWSTPTGSLSVAVPAGLGRRRMLGLDAGDQVRLVRLDDADGEPARASRPRSQLRRRRRPMRPATTIALALLLLAIFVAAIVQFALLAD